MIELFNYDIRSRFAIWINSVYRLNLLGQTTKIRYRAYCLVVDVSDHKTLTHTSLGKQTTLLYRLQLHTTSNVEFPCCALIYIGKTTAQHLNHIDILLGE